MDEKIEKNIQELLDKRNKNAIISEACQEIKFTKKSFRQYIIGITFSVVFSVIFGISENTVTIYEQAVEMLNTVILALLAMIFGSYAVFQALLNKEMIVELIKSKNNLLKESNSTFINLIILYVFDVVVNISVLMAMLVIPKDFIIFNSVMISNIVAIILIFLYLFFNILLILEVINFAINLYRMFCLHNTLKAIDCIESDEDN